MCGYSLENKGCYLVSAGDGFTSHQLQARLSEHTYGTVMCGECADDLCETDKEIIERRCVPRGFPPTTDVAEDNWEQYIPTGLESDDDDTMID